MNTVILEHVLVLNEVYTLNSLPFKRHSKYNELVELLGTEFKYTGKKEEGKGLKFKSLVNHNTYILFPSVFINSTRFEYNSRILHNKSNLALVANMDFTANKFSDSSITYEIKAGTILTHYERQGKTLIAFINGVGYCIPVYAIGYVIDKTKSASIIVNSTYSILDTTIENINNPVSIIDKVPLPVDYTYPLTSSDSISNAYLTAPINSFNAINILDEIKEVVTIVYEVRGVQFSTRQDAENALKLLNLKQEV